MWQGVALQTINLFFDRIFPTPTRVGKEHGRVVVVVVAWHSFGPCRIGAVVMYYQAGR